MKLLLTITISFVYLCGFCQNKKHKNKADYSRISSWTSNDTIGIMIGGSDTDGIYGRLPLDTKIVIDTTQYLRFDESKFDTIPVVLIYIDTSNYVLWKGSSLGWDSIKNVFNVIERIDTIYFDDENQKGGSRWKFGYEVREKHNNTEGVIDPYMSQGFQYREYWVHLYYLDDKKKPLPVSNIILQSINRK